MHLRVLRFAALIVPVLVLGAMSLSPARAQDDNELAQLLLDGMRLYSQGKYAKALPLAERSVARARTRHGEKGMEFATAASFLGMVYQAQGRYADAEPLHQRALAIYETTLGREHSVVTTPLNALASLYEDQGRYADAEPLYKRSLAIKERTVGPDDPSVATSLNNLAHLYMRQGRYADAEPVFKRSLAIRESALRRDRPPAGTGKNFDDLAVISRDIDRDAVPRALNNLAELYAAQGRYAEAEPLLKRSLAMDEAALGRDHPSVATGLNNLAGLYVAQGRYDDAEPLYRRSLAIREKALGREHLDVAASLNNMATLYSNQRRYADAEPLLKRSLAVFESALGRDHPSVATSLNNLASLYDDQGRYAEAEPLLKRSLAIREKALGREHPDVATSLNNLAGLYVALGRHADAGPLYKSSFAIRERALGPEHPEVATSLNNLAFVALAQRDWGQAADDWRRATGVIERRTLRGLAGAAEGSSKGEAQRSSWYFAGLVQATYHLATERRAPGAPAAPMFETAQWALASEVAASLAQMAARSAAGSLELSGLVRERQDLVGEWQVKDKLLIAAKGREPGKGSAAAEKALAERLDAIEARLAVIGRTLARDFPDYAALASPASVSVADVQAQLGADEALVLFLDTNNRFKPLPEATFVWVVTKSEVRWVRSALGTEALKREVAALRCGLDTALWDDAAESKACSSMLNLHERADSGSYGNVLPFNLQRSHALYKGLLDEVEDLIAGKQLLIVPSGALTQLPFQVLVTEPPKTSVPAESAGYRDASWLGARQPITVLPAVSSLKALRAHARPSVAGKAYFGIGNPLLDGRPADPNDVARAKLARAKQTCATTPVKAAAVGGRAVA
jgi:tetratricopeptide (TPR) repeat protein